MSPAANGGEQSFDLEGGGSSAVLVDSASARRPAFVRALVVDGVAGDSEEPNRQEVLRTVRARFAVEVAVFAGRVSRSRA
ncbi:hypothetical protein [Streptomyces sp. NBC_00076]|uniref:hypothetical protein n=1 Tax=Streptomyces sp. NBC_00076 TaxID=2975642 RepID=UPI003252737E